jgi:hypothetical protein
LMAADHAGTLITTAETLSAPPAVSAAVTNAAALKTSEVDRIEAIRASGTISVKP